MLYRCLQFVEAISYTVFVLLLVGTVLATASQAEEDPLDPGIARSCEDCCACNQNDQICRKSNSGRSCLNYTCNCNCSFGINATWLCKPL